MTTERRMNRRERMARMERELVEMRRKLDAFVTALLLYTVLELFKIARMVVWTDYCTIAVMVGVWFGLAYGVADSIRKGTFCDDEAGVIGLFVVLPGFACLIMGYTATVIEKRELA
jgi:hypothetical protein